MKSRCVLLSSPCSPGLTKYWLDTFNIWKDEIDKVYLCTAFTGEPNAKEYILNILKHPKINIIEYDKKPNEAYPNGMNKVIQYINEDLICIMHDDTFVYRSGIMDKYFTKAENNIVCTPFDITYSEADYVKKILSNLYPDLNVPCYSFLLYFTFLSKELLDKTSKILTSGNFNPGYHELFGGIIDRRVGGDVGFVLGLELMKIGAKFEEIIINRPSSALWSENPIEEMIKWNPKYLHAWTLGYTYMDLDIQNKCPKEIKAVRESLSFRLAYLDECMKYDFSEISWYPEKMKEKRETLVKNIGLDENRINEYRNIIKSFKGENYEIK